MAQKTVELMELVEQLDDLIRQMRENNEERRTHNFGRLSYEQHYEKGSAIETQQRALRRLKVTYNTRDLLD